MASVDLYLSARNTTISVGNGGKGKGNPPVSPIPAPIMLWNRLEGRPRKTNDQSYNNRPMRAEVRDPLWMLCRQWQWGEFQGEDNGSLVFAKVHKRTQHINKTALGDFSASGDLQLPANAEAYSDDMPLEMRMERINDPELFFNPLMKLKIGRKWKQLLDSYAFVDASYHDQFLAMDGSGIAPDLQYDPMSTGTVNDGSQMARKQAWQIQRIGTTKWTDGAKLYAALQEVLPTVHTWIVYGDAGDQSLMENAIIEFNDWMTKTFNIQSEETAWNPHRLEYTGGVAVPEDAQGQAATVMVSREYHHGSLDWHSFDIFPDQGHAPLYDQLFMPASPGSSPLITEEKLTVFPTRIAYSGMPADRWWEMEDANVNFGRLKTENKDLAPLLVTQFGLMYSNDWNLIPIVSETGTLTGVKSVIVTDSFGIKTLVEPAGEGNNNDWHRWSMFNMHTEGVTDGYKLDQRLFIPPVVQDVQESDPIEQVEFVRDEMANLVWAIETTVPNYMGGGQEGKHTAQLVNDHISGFITQSIEDQNGEVLDPLEGVEIRYQLQNEVPCNWIPFVPANFGAGPGQDPDVRMVRSRMRRVLPNIDALVNPANQVTHVLPETHLVQEDRMPYYIYDEELLKSGIKVSTTYQRTRWIDGKTYVWVGRRKTAGRGEAWSNLQFDQLKYNS